VIKNKVMDWDEEVEQRVIRVDILLNVRAEVLSRIPIDDRIASYYARTDRLGKLTTRVDFWKRWEDPHGGRTVRRVSIRISEIRGGFSFTRFDGGRATFKTAGRSFLGLGVYARARLL